MLLGFKNTANQNEDLDKRAVCAVLSNAQMAKADSLAAETLGESYPLMLSAGQAVANIVHEHYEQHDVVILAGPGNNGGDGFVAAMFLQDLGHNVHVLGLAPARKYKGDAKQAYKAWGGKLLPFKALPECENKVVIIDALFGTGFRGSLEPPVTNLFSEIVQQKLPVIAIDVPSGVNGDTGVVDANCLTAARTVTFYKKKLGHVLMPSLELCGHISVHDIGIEDEVISETGCVGYDNQPAFWQEEMPRIQGSSHKYKRGHVVMLGGGRMTGAIRMSSESAMRMGAGLASIVCPPDVMQVYQKEGAAHILVEVLRDGYVGFAEHCKDEKRTAILIGPGAGLDYVAGLKQAVLDCLTLGKPIVLDADALSCFSDEPQELLDAMHENCVITPHEGEFTRLFPNVEGLKHDRVLLAAAMTKATILLKGADTVIGQEGRKPVFHTHATAWLGTAGAGDVLAGMIAGLLAQGMTPFEATCEAAWMHGEAGLRKGAGLVAPDLIEEIPSILRNFS